MEEERKWDVGSYDHLTDFVDDPRPLWRHLREQDPVAWTDKHYGHYLISRYHDVGVGLRDASTFSSAYGILVTSVPSGELGTRSDHGEPIVRNGPPLDVDPPDVLEYRRPVNAAMSPGKVARYEGVAVGVAEELLDGLSDRDHLDFCLDYSQWFPPSVTMQVIGFPLADLDIVRSDLARFSAGAGDHPEEIPVAVAAVNDYLLDLLRRRRAEEPRDDVIGSLLAARFRGRPFTDDEMVQVLFNVLLGAIGTTIRTLNQAALYLALHPELASELRRRDDLWDTAVEEFLRYGSGVQGMGRTTTRDTEVAGCPIPKHSRVRFLMGSANFDPEVFERPDEMILDRTPNQHLAFGSGPHKCPGRHVARLMVRVALRAFLDRTEAFEVADPSAIRFSAMETGSSIDSLPLNVRMAKT